MRLLIVCLGNICRSPLAEGILQKKLREAGLDWQVESAGTNGIHVGQAPHQLSQKVARQNGVDISTQRARQFAAEDLKNYDRIYVMAEDVLHEMRAIAGKDFDESQVDYFLNPLYPGRNKDVPDPWYGDEDGYIEVYEIIDQACSAIIEHITAHKKEKV